MSRNHAAAAEPEGRTQEPRSMRGYLPHYLSRLMNILNLRLLEHLRPLDLTVQQFRIMQMLDARKSASVGEISRDTVIEQSVVSRIVGQLENRGYASRAKRADNARIVDVRLTHEGQKIYGGIPPLSMAIVDDATGVLSTAEKVLLEEFLERIFDHLATPRYPWLDSKR
ncbi:MarR family transcriptional regulator [Bradyrhizobium sp. NP1]|jgi:DNA-binding MarR family transcriptional regulator|uniref:MarR family winged helix-turn-helix transcriptional regulator n=1 Tax=Bradyrhizobium sp. NP1 TaxID=3049772 RepID=UPI0025A61F54|nr:MarR family transcriptional regulator [Bradyrhizobium sp. NP1]WJR79211.1 MarR family transcriptional regulator [Bradyrhizobium sp. NP1]